MRGVLTGHPLAPIRLANDTNVSVLIRPDNDAAASHFVQSERAATASQSGKTEGEGVSLHFFVLCLRSMEKLMDINDKIRTSVHPLMANKSAVRTIHWRLQGSGLMC